MSGQPERRSRAGLAVVAAIVFLAGMATSTQFLGRDRPAAEPSSGHREAPAPPGEEPTGGQPGRPLPDEQAAIDTALALASASQSWLYLADDELEAAVRSVATEASADMLVSDTLAEVGLVRDALAQSTGQIWWVVRPLAWRVESLGAQRAAVSVWSVSVLSAAGVAMPQADWMTVTLDLTWEHGTWKLSGTREVPGPTPQIGGRDTGWDPVPFDEALAGFQRIGSEAG